MSDDKEDPPRAPAHVFYTNMVLHRDALVAFCGHLEQTVYGDNCAGHLKALGSLLFFFDYPATDTALSATGLRYKSYLSSKKVYEDADKYIRLDMAKPDRQSARYMLARLQGFADMSASLSLAEWHKEVSLPLKPAESKAE